MRCLVTGVAGFIGSSLADRLLADGHDVVGLDAFTDYYAPSAKEQNLAGALAHPRFTLVRDNLGTTPLEPLLEGTGVVYHQAAQPGVRGSWGSHFGYYVQQNVLATQRLLEALQGRKIKLVYASSSSVYGDTADLPMRESSATRPFSPYGVTKLAAEHLCEVYRTNFGVPAASLRYFTVYGPRQRPDMAFHKLCEALLDGRPFAVYGDGEQTRDFTFVADAVQANVLAAEPGREGVFNVGGGSRVTLREVVGTLGRIAGSPPQIDRQPPQPGDVRHTWSDATRARDVLGFAPKVSLAEGLAAQLDWHRARRSA